MNLRPLLLAVVIVTFTLLFAPSARACWDGWAASAGRVHVVQSGDARWNPAVARSFAAWAPRIEALLPADVELTSEHGYVTLTKDGGRTTVAEGRWDGHDLRALFSWTRTAVATKAMPAQPGATAFTVQVFASHDLRAAEAYAASVDARARQATRPLGLDDNFYSAGGYPAVHALAHVVTETVPAADTTPSQTIHRVVVGAFLDRDAAERARTGLADAAGATGFVRVL